MATSTVLSAMSVRSVAASADASTMRTFAGSLCRNNSFRKAFASALVISEESLHSTN